MTKLWIEITYYDRHTDSYVAVERYCVFALFIYHNATFMQLCSFEHDDIALTFLNYWNEFLFIYEKWVNIE